MYQSKARFENGIVYVGGNAYECTDKEIPVVIYDVSNEHGTEWGDDDTAKLNSLLRSLRECGSIIETSPANALKEDFTLSSSPTVMILQL